MTRAFFETTWLLFLLAICALLATGTAGCSQSSRLGDTDPGDGGPPGDDDDDLAPPGDDDDDDDPPGDCAPMDVQATGACDLFLGYAWVIGTCQGLTGCACEGADCDRLFGDPDACEAAFRECPAPDVCGGFIGAPCDEDQWCDFVDGDLCGAADGIGVCRPRPTVCPGVVEPVCGCDGETYGNACLAHADGVDLRNDMPCMTTF